MESALRTHTLPQALSLLYDICQVPYKAKRTWKTLLEYLEKCDGDVQERIHRAAQAKIGSKRKAVDPITSDARAKKRPRLRDGHGQDQIPAHQSASRTVQELVDGPFLAIAPEHVLNDCIAKYGQSSYLASYREVLTRAQFYRSYWQCSHGQKDLYRVRARRMFARSFHTMAMGDIPNIHILRPTHPHHGHFLVDGALLHSTANPDSLNDVCKSCLGNLTKSTLPKLALANNMWLGDVPFELSILTLPEQLLVSLYFPAAYIIKIYPKNVKPSQDPAKRAEETIPIANEKLRGNVSTFRLPTNEIAHMVAGNNVPRPSLLLAAVIGVTFVGVNPKTMNIMPGIFRVRRQRVFDAVMWLKTHNAIYADVIISEENLRSLPEDGVPEEISQNITVSDDIDAVGREHAGYVPTSTGDHSDNEEDGQPDFTQDKDTEDDESDNLSIAHESTHSSVDNMEVEPIGTIPFSSPLVSTSNQRTTTDEPQVFPLQPHGVLDVGGNNIPETTLFSHAVENVVPALYAQDYGVRKGNAFVNEYARVDDNRERYDGGTIDPNHLLGAFPILFPYGLGGFEVDRQRKVTYEEHVKWALQYEDFRFRKHTLFAFQVFGVLLKRQICRSASLQIDHNQFLANQTAIKQLTPKDLLRASEEESTGRAISNPTIRLLRKHITTVRARVQGTDEKGIFGKLNGYIGTVEAQARGSLHLHMLLWLPDAPTSAMMQEALKSDAFRQKIKTFIRHNIRSDIRGVMMPAEARKRAANKVSYSRPVDPRKEGYQQKTSAVEDHNAAALQSHECSIYYCLKSTKGRVACKRGYPWPTYPDDWVDADGRWGAKRRFPFLNPWNPPIFSVTRSNMDIKLLTNACETKDIAFYITLYIAKKQVQAANASAVLARSRAFVRDEDSTTPVQNANRPNNTRIKRRRNPSTQPSTTRAIADYNAGASQAGTIILENGEFTLQDQLGQYADRGEKLEDMNMYEFFLRTYHVSSAKGTSSEQDADDTEDANRIGRPPNQRVPYTDASGRAGLRVLRGTNQETALHLVGRWLPKVNDINQENYAAQVLLLLKPWRTLDDLQGTYHSFADAKTAFLHTAPPEHGQIVENIQYYHDSSAQARHSKDSTEDPETTEDIEHNQDTPQAAEDFSLFNTLSQADIEEARRTQISELDQKYGLDGLAVAERAGIFANLSPTNPAHRLPLAVNATEEEMLVLKDWEAKE
ncbi:ATP-dependent DNA helicase [Mycena indigotica]|uniref:ATP-dependent DNA helicase n=1 Tax=Mycena indigotica TaxID=2126181 RepID=A0A8H6SMJ1_9AGAR|nr:ATP-dependent DNA helicase [Mycena indigotica]KAF7302074.1 ATP-dependent DNA helicase [Mycena indigotica]